MDLGAHGHLLTLNAASPATAGALVVAGQEEGQGSRPTPCQSSTARPCASRSGMIRQGTDGRDRRDKSDGGRDLCALRVGRRVEIHPRRRTGQSDGELSSWRRWPKGIDEGSTSRRPSSTSRRLTFHVRRTFPQTTSQEPRDFKTPNYGMTTFADLFTPRQLTALTTFSDLVGGPGTNPARRPGFRHARRRSPRSRRYQCRRLRRCGGDLHGFCSERDCRPFLNDLQLDSSASKIRNAFARQALPMNWDFAESTCSRHPRATFRGSLMGGRIVGVMDRQRDWRRVIRHQRSRSAI